MIILGPILLVLSGFLIVLSAQPEWVTVLEEEDFDYEYWEEAYTANVQGSDINEQMRVIIKEKTGMNISISFWIEDDWGYEEFRDGGQTPEIYDIDLDYVYQFDDFEFFIKIHDDRYDIDDLDVTIQKYGISNSFLGFCIGSSLLALLGITLLIMGIIFTAVYSTRIKQQDPAFIREEMIRKQEGMMREQQARKAQEMERIRQRQAMMIRARHLESAYRLDEAAFMYERMDMFEDAGRCRRKKKEEVSRHIHVNANQLFDKLQQKGTALPYLCPRCHGMVEIDGVDHKYTTCPYCGATVDFETLRKAAGNLLQ